MKDTRIIIFLLLVLVPTINACVNNAERQEQKFVNLSHLKHLYTDATLANGTEVGLVHIYSEYPDYEFAIEPDEGYTCVDDVARALVLLSDYKSYNEDPDIEAMIHGMTQFILEMQAKNGYFYNFLWGDLSINKTFRTSLPEPNWWSWRALWALSEIYPHLSEELAQKAKESTGNLISVVLDSYLEYPSDTINYKGIDLPNWFPLGTAFDQSAILIIAMISYHNNIVQDKRVLDLIEKFADGLILIQKGDEKSFPYYAYLSWNNLWHSYGNIQSYAMLKAGRFLQKKELINSALREIDHFYPYLMDKGIAHHFYLEASEEGFYKGESEMFPQIAYGIRPVVYACLEAYDITGDKKYIQLGEKAASWLAGNNPAKKMIYDPLNGRCFDGIVSETEVNQNSGAESTIEALLTLQAIEKHAVADINKVYRNYGEKDHH